MITLEQLQSIQERLGNAAFTPKQDMNTSGYSRNEDNEAIVTYNLMLNGNEYYA